MDPLRRLAWAGARPALFALDAETAHAWTLAALDALAVPPAIGTAGLRLLAGAPVRDPVELMGLRFPNRIGLAAGLDKDARHVDALAGLGFGFIELGTVTPRPQPGNPHPRLFRLPAADALINRFGFNNAGLAAFLASVTASRTWQRRHAGETADATPIIGLNIGKNATTPIADALDDYRTGLQGAYPVADYIVVNVSSPNTANLRSLQGGDELSTLLAGLDAERARLARDTGHAVPMLLKIAPDLDEAQIAAIVAGLTRFSIDGVIATNTTLARDAVAGLPHGAEAGGLSGRPVFAASNQVIRALRAALPPRYPIIGVGGVMSASDALAKIDCGADLVQLYTGLIYRGPALIGDCARAMRDGGRPRP